MPVPFKDCVFILDGEEIKGMESFLDHIIKKDVTVSPEQQRSDVIAAQQAGYEHPTEALRSVNKRLGTDYKKFSEIPSKELERASKERRIEKVNKTIDDAADRLIKMLSAKLPEGTEKQGVGVEEVIRAGADIVKKAYKAGEDVREAINNAVDYIKSNWDESWGKFDEDTVRSHFNDDMYATGVFAKDTPREESTGGLKPIDFPELVQIARAIAGGKYPLTKEMRNALGYFRPSIKNIALSKELFKQEHYEDLLKTIAHEIGHFIDFIPDETMKRGNILGRIASLKDFMKQYLPFKPGAEGPLTDAEKQRIAREVKKNATKTTREIDEEIEKTIGLTPQDVMDIWNSVDAGRNNPELLDFIGRLSTEDKKSIIKEAMKGELSDKLKGFVRTIKEKTGKKITIENEADPEAIKAEIKKRIEEEIRKRKLWNEKEIYDEAYNLSKEWRPFDESTASQQELNYRKKGEEIYADMISVLFNSPGMLETKAPKFFEAFMNYLDAKPAFKQVYEDTQRLLNDPASIQAARTANTLSGFEAARQRRREVQQQQAAYRSAEKVWGTFKKQFVSTLFPVIDKLPGKQKGEVMSVREKVRDAVEQMFMWKSKTAMLMDDYKKITDTFSGNGIDIDHVGALSQYIRNMGRKDKANPLGFQLEEHNLDAAKTILDMYSPKQQDIIEKGLRNWYDANFNVMQYAYDNGLLTQDMWQTVQANKYNYATFKPVKYIDEKLQTAALLNVKGTLSEVANPFVETMVKIAMIQRAAERNGAINLTKEALQKYSPESVKETKVDAFTKRPKDELKYGEDYIFHKVNGTTRVFITDKDVAKIFNFEEPEKINLAIKVVNALSNPLKAAWTRYNPGFVFYSNLIKDGQRSLSNMVSILSATETAKAYNYFTLGAEYLGNVYSSFKEGTNILRQNPSELGRRMLANGAINPESAIFSKYNPEMSAMGNIMAHFEATQQHLGLEKAKEGIAKRIGNILLYPLDWLISEPGQRLEMMNKVIGYKMLEKRMGSKAAAYYTRNYIGTPNYSEHTGVNYSWVPFAKVIIQGVRNDVALAGGKRSAGAYWLTKALYSALPAVLSGMAYKGYLDDDKTPKGQKLSDALNNLSKYQRYNYINIPLKQTPDGKTGLVQVPMDDISKIIYQEVMNTFENEDAAAHARDVWSPIAQQLPDYEGGITMYKNWYQFLAEGVNPYDDFYHKNIISDRNFKRGGLAALGDMAKYTYNQIGIRLPQKDLSETTTTREKLLAVPGINRIYKETNAGLYDMLRNVKADTDEKSATRLDNMDKAISSVLDDQTRKAIKDEGYNPLTANEMADRVYEAYTGKISRDTEQDQADYKLIKQKMKLLSQKVVLASIPIANAVLSASTYDQKQAILQEYQKHASVEEYDELIRLLDENGVKYERTDKSQGGFKVFQFGNK